MRARVLGTFQLERDGEEVTPPGGQVGKLFRLLLLHPNQTIDSSDLAESLWPDVAPEGVASRQRRLYVAVSRLRTFLDSSGDEAGPRIEKIKDGYMLVAEPESLDRVEFESAATQALHSGDPIQIEKALATWGGEPYAGFEWTPELRSQRHALAELRRRLVETKLGGDAGKGLGEKLSGVKFASPRLDTQSVTDRPRLLQQLGAVGEATVVSVVAPAGYGKSLLLSQWSNQQSVPVAWMNLDEGDDDPVQFWTSVVGALAETTNVDLRPDSDEAYVGTSAFLEGVGEILQDGNTPLALVLEDFHRIANPTIHSQVERFVAAVPASATIAVSSRSPLPFPTARMQADGRFRKIDARDLRFTPSEIRLLLESEEAEFAEAIWELTEGWPVAVRMLIAFPEAGRQTGLVGSMGEFLIEEIVDSAPEEIREFMLRIAPLDAFSPALCQAVTASADAGEQLSWLVDHQLCTVVGGSEHEWYRMHPLLSADLRSRAEADPAIDEGEIQREAARWFRRQEAKEEALRYAVAGREASIVAATAGDVLVETGLRQQAVSCVRWLRAIHPEDVAADRRSFAIAVCMASIWSPHQDRLRWILSRNRYGDGDGDVVLDFARALDDIRGGRSTEAVELLHHVINGASEYGGFAPDLVPFLVGISFSSLVEARMYQGTLHPDDEIFSNALGLVRPFAPLVAAWIHSHWSLVSFLEGNDDLAVAMADEHYQLRRRAEMSRVARPDNTVVGALAAARGVTDPTELRRQALGLDDLIDGYDRLGDYTSAALTRLVIAGLYRKGGDVERSGRHQDKAERLLLTFPDAPFLSRFAEAVDGILSRQEAPDLIGLLTSREQTILGYLATDLSNKQIARHLYLSPNTVRRHISSIYRKIGVHSRHQAILKVPPDDLDRLRPSLRPSTDG